MFFIVDKDAISKYFRFVEWKHVMPTVLGEHGNGLVALADNVEGPVKFYYRIIHKHDAQQTIWEVEALRIFDKMLHQVTSELR